MGKRKKRRLAKASAPRSFREASASYRRMRKAGYHSLDEVVKIAKNVDKKLAKKDEEIENLKAMAAGLVSDLAMAQKDYDDMVSIDREDLKVEIARAVITSACATSCGSCPGCKSREKNTRAGLAAAAKASPCLDNWGIGYDADDDNWGDSPYLDHY
jgi:hypothetical protein